MRATETNRPEPSRGQTSLDFAVGASTFLLVLAFVLTFVPGMLEPFDASGQEDIVVADRIADQLTGGSSAIRTRRTC